MTAEKNSSFTPAEIARLKDIVTYWGPRPVKWDLYIDEFGTHPLGSIKVMASQLRNSARRLRERDKNREIKRALRLIRDMADDVKSDGSMREPRAIGVDSHRINTSTQPMQFAAEMRRRIETQGVTAGLLGDPLPGRSALDRKRAGIVDDNRRELRERQYAETSGQLWRLRWKRERGELGAK